MSKKKALNGDMLYLIFDTANMHRWNDHLRTVDLTELDKQAHKAAIAWVLGKYEETEGGAKLDWRKIIEHSLFSFIQRSAMTDLKPQVFHRIISEKAEEVNRYVVDCFDLNVPDADPEFRSRLEGYLRSEKRSKEDDIIRAAHYLATRWEFKTVYDANRSMYGIENTKKEIDEQILQHMDLIGVKKQMDDENTFDFIDLIGQLRFQQRWARTPRIPKTTVLGHSLLVADMIFLNDFDTKADNRQMYNNYYTALFHDLPEVLTKDVISPIKANVDGLAHLLESYERELVQSKIMPLIPGSWHEEIEFMVFEPFTDIDNGRFGRRTGKDIKSCDLMAAYIEAKASVSYGISSKPLEDGVKELRKKLRASGAGIGAEDLLDQLDRVLR
ncbi:MAG: HD domain-containing protein [Candidatus Methanoplasma sp.]|jgi:putative hydrolase of HD superfamily|nr:HD domain-containing protein [Candidatus Methanoplasma sp.]